MKIISTIYPKIGPGEIVVIRHGGKGSGFSKEAGHKGRPGEIGGSMSGQSIMDAPSIDDFENGISKQTFETAGIYKDGKLILRKNGSDHNVKFTDEDIMLMKDAILTHNHPSNGTFSRDDIKMMAFSELKEIRAVGTFSTCSMINDIGNGNKLSVYQFLHFREMAIDNLVKLPNVDNMSKQEFEDSIWIEFARVSGLTYKRIPR